MVPHKRLNRSLGFEEINSLLPNGRSFRRPSTFRETRVFQNICTVSKHFKLGFQNGDKNAWIHADFVLLNPDVHVKGVFTGNQVSVKILCLFDVLLLSYIFLIVRFTVGFLIILSFGFRLIILLFYGRVFLCFFVFKILFFHPLISWIQFLDRLFCLFFFNKRFG